MVFEHYLKSGKVFCKKKKVMLSTKMGFAPTLSDEVAEWLRRWTANPMCSARMGSYPILVVAFFFQFLLFITLRKCIFLRVTTHITRLWNRLFRSCLSTFLSFVIDNSVFFQSLLFEINLRFVNSGQIEAG